MFAPDDPLAPAAPAFAEPWHAEVLAIADAMIRAGHFSQTEWATRLGAELRRAETDGQPDTPGAYYGAALAALEQLSAARAGIGTEEQARRKAEWASAYHHTPHGQPVLLKSAERKPDHR